MTRRPPGQIRDSIIRYLSLRQEPATIREIHAAIESELSGEVAASSIRSYLNLGVGSQFERVTRGRYQLRSQR